jgi:beta-N-acetylhexosaminidase
MSALPTVHRPLGPVMVDVAGLELDAQERELLAHPAVGGVILFARNYANPEQVSRLTADIHAVRTPPLLIAVDHEGGRVQRFREGFTRLPAMRDLGVLRDHAPAAARNLARSIGSVLAHELRACGVDFSFAPVLDLDHGRSGVIGDRAFHTDPDAVADLAGALVAGLADGGMGAVGKHFPGHGFAEADSHTAMPVDERSLEEIERQDLEPFRRLVAAGLEGIMPAHVLYSRVDPQPAGYSRFWLQTVLRERLGFDGTIFSDDLTMVGAHGAGNIVERGWLALDAGCDIVLVCNDPPAAAMLLEGLQRACAPAALGRLARLHGQPRPGSFATLRASPAYLAALDAVAHRPSIA